MLIKKTNVGDLKYNKIFCETRSIYINIENNVGEIPLLIAFKNEHNNIVNYLIDHGEKITINIQRYKKILFPFYFHLFLIILF